MIPGSARTARYGQELSVNPLSTLSSVRPAGRRVPRRLQPTPLTKRIAAASGDSAPPRRLGERAPQRQLDKLELTPRIGLVRGGQSYTGRGRFRRGARREALCLVEVGSLLPGHDDVPRGVDGASRSARLSARSGGGNRALCRLAT